MRKIIYLTLIVLVIAGFYGCKRNQAPTPGDIFGPSSHSVVLQLTANPSVVQALSVDRNNSSNISVLRAKLYDYQKGPMAGRAVIFYIDSISVPFTSPSTSWSCGFVGSEGKLNGDQSKSVKAITDSSGIATVTYTPPSTYEMRVVCDTGQTDPVTGDPILEVYNVNYITVYIKATWRNQEWPEDSLSEVESTAVIKVLR